MAARYPDPDHSLDLWVKRFVRIDGPTDTLAMLIAITESIKGDVKYAARLVVVFAAHAAAISVDHFAIGPAERDRDLQILITTFAECARRCLDDSPPIDDSLAGLPL